MPWVYVINDLKIKEIIGTFYEKALQKKKINLEFRVEKVIKRKRDKLYVKWTSYDNYFDSWIDKKDIVCIIKYLPELKSSGGRLKVELNLSNYATKADLKNATSVDISKFAKKFDLANSKSIWD